MLLPVRAIFPLKVNRLRNVDYLHVLAVNHEYVTIGAHATKSHIKVKIVLPYLSHRFSHMVCNCRTVAD